MNSSDIFVKINSDVSYHSRRNIWKPLKLACDNIHYSVEYQIGVAVVDELIRIFHPICTEIHKTNQNCQF